MTFVLIPSCGCCDNLYTGHTNCHTHGRWVCRPASRGYHPSFPLQGNQSIVFSSKESVVTAASVDNLGSAVMNDSTDPVTIMGVAPMSPLGWAHFTPHHMLHITLRIWSARQLLQHFIIFCRVQNTPMEVGMQRANLYPNTLLLLLLSSSSSLSSSPLCRVFIHTFLRQTMSLVNTVLQLFCCYYSYR